jgi:AraC-like DNA-binding protein
MKPDGKPDIEFARLWESSIPGIELYRAHLSRHRFGKHFHESYTIGLNLSGQGCFQQGGQTHLAVPSSFHLINPGTVHTGEVLPQTHWSFCDLYLSLPIVETVLAQMEWHGQFPAFRQPVVIDRSLQARFYRLFHALSEPASLLEQQSLLLEALSQLFLRHAFCRDRLLAPKPESNAVAQVRAYLEAHYAESVSIDALANLVRLSPFYLIRSFQQQVSLPPHAYQRHWQLIQAKRSLCTEKSLAEIALENGFYDQSHLNRSFKQTFGITPGQYRKSNFVQDREVAALIV